MKGRGGERQAWLFALPTILLLLVFCYYPAGFALRMAFARWDIGGQPQWVGLNHFANLMRDPVFRAGAANLLKLLAFALCVGLWMPLLAAEFIFHAGTERRRYLLRALFVVPMVVPLIVLWLIWKGIYGDAGAVTGFLELIGREEWIRGWLSDPHTALPAVMFVGFPFVSGFPMLIYYAGLSNISESVLDAARIDGATTWGAVRHIHLPMIRPQVRLLAILTVLGVVQGYEAMYVLTGDGGPGYCTMVPGLYMYQNGFSYGRMGYASAIGLVMFVAILVFTLGVQRYLRGEAEEGRGPR